MAGKIIYSVKNIGVHTLIEARLTGPVRNSDWITFFGEITTSLNDTERLYMLVDENKYENDINYNTASVLLKKASNAPIKEFTISFSTSDPMKRQLAKLFRVMAEIANVPLVISYSLSKTEARNVIKNLCLSCYAKMTGGAK